VPETKGKDLETIGEFFKKRTNEHAPKMDDKKDVE
jgi:hypothetical protein